MDGSTGILLVNHGSHSPTWRRMLLEVQAGVADQLLAIPGVTRVRTAFMEYTEPSIASQLRAFDHEGVERIILVPLLLTVSDHSLDDIPAICGMSHNRGCLSKLEKDKIEVYRPRAELVTTPLLDYPGLASENLVRRVETLLPGGVGSGDAVVLVGYGSAEFDDEWTRFFLDLGRHAERTLGLVGSTHAWCGHIARYRREPTVDAIDRMLRVADRVGVIPVLVAYDEMFQDRIIGGAVRRAGEAGRVFYRPDAILPEPAVGRWILEAVVAALGPLSTGSDR